MGNTLIIIVKIPKSRIKIICVCACVWKTYYPDLLPVSLRNNTSIFFSSSYFTLLIRKKWNYSLIHFMIIYLVISLSTLKLLKYQILHNLVFTCFHGNFHISMKKKIQWFKSDKLHKWNKPTQSKQSLWEQSLMKIHISESVEAAFCCGTETTILQWLIEHYGWFLHVYQRRAETTAGNVPVSGWTVRVGSSNCPLGDIYEWW